jgi:hypothetical protein
VLARDVGSLMDVTMAAVLVDWMVFHENAGYYYDCMICIVY